MTRKVRNFTAWCIPYLMVALAVNCAIVLHTADNRRNNSTPEISMQRIQLETELFDVPTLEAPIVVIEKNGTRTRMANTPGMQIKVQEVTVLSFTDSSRRELHESIELTPMDDSPQVYPQAEALMQATEAADKEAIDKEAADKEAAAKEAADKEAADKEAADKEAAAKEAAAYQVMLDEEAEESNEDCDDGACQD